MDTTASSKDPTAAPSLTSAEDTESAKPAPLTSEESSLKSSNVSDDASLDHLDHQKRDLILKFRSITTILATINRCWPSQLGAPTKVMFRSPAISSSQSRDETVQFLTALATILVMDSEVVAVAAVIELNGLSVIVTKHDQIHQARQPPPTTTVISPCVTVQDPVVNHGVQDSKDAHTCKGCEKDMREQEIDTSHARYVFAVALDKDVWPMNLKTVDPVSLANDDLQRLFCPKRTFVQHVSALSHLLGDAMYGDARAHTLLRTYVIASTVQKTVRRVNAIASEHVSDVIRDFTPKEDLVSSFIVIVKTRKFDALFYGSVVKPIGPLLESGRWVLEDVLMKKFKELVILCDAGQPFFKPETFEILHEIMRFVMALYRTTVTRCAEMAEPSKDSFLDLGFSTMIYWRMVYSDTFTDYVMTISRIKATSGSFHEAAVPSKDTADDDNHNNSDNSIPGNTAMGKEDIDGWFCREDAANFGGLEDAQTDLNVLWRYWGVHAFEILPLHVRNRSKEYLVCARYQVFHVEALERLFTKIKRLKIRMKIRIAATHAPPVLQKENWVQTILDLKDHRFTTRDATKAIHALQDIADFEEDLESTYTSLHCEAVLASLTHCVANPLLSDDMAMFLKESGISLKNIDEHIIGISELCCPVCTKLLGVLRGNTDYLQVRGGHKQRLPCTLPSWLPLNMLETMVTYFSRRLRTVLLNINGPVADSHYSSSHNSHIFTSSDADKDVPFGPRFRV